MLAIAVCQLHRYRQQAGSYKGIGESLNSQRWPPPEIAAFLFVQMIGSDPTPVGAGWLAIAVCQLHRYRQQAGSYKGIGESHQFVTLAATRDRGVSVCPDDWKRPLRL
ncbi:hypothetical protein [Pseudomonas putida]|uniref:hypothetical protein n=1 Tax=Pseudomonas putida TaxID=303 RepID=UPI003D964208